LNKHGAPSSPACRPETQFLPQRRSRRRRRKGN
jgi:hypothetical protein